MDNRHRNDTCTQFLARHRKTIWSVCWRHADGDEELLRDMVQEVSVQLCLRMDRLRPGASPQAERIWVAMTARSVLHNLSRRKRVDTVRRGERHLTGLAGAAPLQGYDWLKEEMLQRVEPSDRPLLSLRMDGYNIAEIAARLEVSRRTVERRMERIYQRLEGFYEEYLK